MLDDIKRIGLERLSTPYGVFYAEANDLITRQLIEFGAHTRNELAMVLDHVREGEVFVDVGAHIGTFAIPIARKLGPRGKLLAIEGSPKTHALLVKNVGANGLAAHVQTICAIAGKGMGQGVQRLETGGNTGAGFYLPKAGSSCQALDARWIVCAQGFARLDFVKIDVEGMELLVLQSLGPLLEVRHPKLYVEIVAEQLARFGATIEELDVFLRGFGYRFFRNISDRNSRNDSYVKIELTSLVEGGGFFDLLALPK